ncbi:hypothetical protein [Oceaniglobus roseus]|uniref:hypothetical protein n=1 Tax=Oceaniglobus roseus TaxID=1737570 RepID=UPI000C7EC066|nr:hypothetical protein [Kandeliimicrobium roseum]
MRVLGWLAAGLLALGAAAPATAAEGRLLVELNKLEPTDTGACRAFFLFRNRTGRTLEAFEMSLAILDSGGVIDRLLTIDAAPLPAGRTTLKLFEIPETGCDDISDVLLHDIPACTPANGEATDCFAFLDLASRASATLSE